MAMFDGARSGSWGGTTMARAWNGTRGTCYHRGNVSLTQSKQIYLPKKQNRSQIKSLMMKLQKGDSLLYLPERHLVMGV